MCHGFPSIFLSLKIYSLQISRATAAFQVSDFCPFHVAKGLSSNNQKVVCVCAYQIARFACIWNLGSHSQKWIPQIPRRSPLPLQKLFPEDGEIHHLVGLTLEKGWFWGGSTYIICI